MSDGSDFYEDDEPVEKIRAAFERGEKGRTAKRPRDLNRMAASIVADATEPPMEPVVVPSDVTSVRIEGVSIGSPGKKYQVKYREYTAAG